MDTEYASHDVLPFPPYCMTFDHKGKLLVAGGGGASKTGVPNQIV